MIHKLSNQKGFTIIELMIATSVLSVMLVMVSAIMISIGHLYTKGINQSKIQSAVRNITDDVSQQIQLGAEVIPVQDPTNPDIKAYCIGNVRYTYILTRMLGNGVDTDNVTPKSEHVLWRDKLTAAGCSTALLGNPDPSAGAGNGSDGAELMPNNSRLLAFDINNLSTASSLATPYGISLGIAYGDIDLLQINTSNPISSLCKGLKGNEFCATAKLNTVASRRLNGSP